jgi:hypothetical protein
MAPGRYRSRYCTAPQPGRLSESPETVDSFAIRSRFSILRAQIEKTTCGEVRSINRQAFKIAKNEDRGSNIAMIDVIRSSILDLGGKSYISPSSADGP